MMRSFEQVHLKGESEVLAFFEQNEALESNGSLVVAQRVKQERRAQMAFRTHEATWPLGHNYDQAGAQVGDQASDEGGRDPEGGKMFSAKT